MEIKAGDVVRLKAGGILMTVESINKATELNEATEQVECVWFANNLVARGNFKAEALKIIPGAD